MPDIRIASYLNARLSEVGLAGAWLPGRAHVLQIDTNNIRIKVHSRKHVVSWLLSEDDENPNVDFYCFIYFGDQGRSESWLVPADVVARILKLSHQTWLSTPTNKNRNPGPLRKFLLDYSEKYPAMAHGYGRGWADQYSQDDVWKKLCLTGASRK